jgi:hypothetical protein
VAQEDGIAPSDQGDTCVHHWLIDAENLGVCKKCGCTRQFRGWWDVAAIRKGWSRSQEGAGGGAADKKG